MPPGDGPAHSAQFVPLAQLCVAEGKSVWTLHVELVCLNSDGSLFDACLAAAVAALVDSAWPSRRVASPTRAVCSSSPTCPGGWGCVLFPPMRSFSARLPTSRYDAERREVVVAPTATIALALGALPVAATYARLDEYGHPRT